MAGRPPSGRKVSSITEDLGYLLDIVAFNHSRIWREKTFLHQKYVIEGLSIAQIARDNLSSRASVRDALIQFGIKRRPKGKPGNRAAQVPYGYRTLNGKTVEHFGEQRVLAIIRKLSDRRMSLRQICDVLSDLGISTKRRNRKKWQPEMVRRILNQPKQCPNSGHEN